MLQSKVVRWYKYVTANILHYQTHVTRILHRLQESISSNMMRSKDAQTPGGASYNVKKPLKLNYDKVSK